MDTVNIVWGVINSESYVPSYCLYEKVSYPSIRMHLYGDVEHGVVESNDAEIV